MDQHESSQHSRSFYSFRNLLRYQKLQYSQPAITCSKLTIETLKQGVKYAQC